MRQEREVQCSVTKFVPKVHTTSPETMTQDITTPFANYVGCDV